MKFKNYIETESGIKDTSTSPGTAGQVLSSTVTGTSWIDQSTLVSGSAERVSILVKNAEGTALVKGDPVYIIGSVGASARLEVGLCDASNPSKMPCVGLLEQDLLNNGEGTAVTAGKLRNLITTPIDGQPTTENDTIYVKAGGSSGLALTTTKPTGSTNLIQNVGQVGRVSASSDGNFVVSAIMRTNDIPNLPTGKIWVGDGNTIVSDVVYLDEANELMGIGTTSPDSKLEVASTNSNTYLHVRNDSTGSTRLKMSNLTDTNSNGFQIINNGLNGQVNLLNYKATTLALWTNSIQRMTISSGGNVGIGTTSPASQLGSAKVLDISSTGNNEIILDHTDAGVNSDIGLYSWNRNNDHLAHIKASCDGATDSAFISFHAQPTGGSFSGPSSNEKMRINSNGNVGIGITTPRTKLHVFGTTSSMPALGTGASAAQIGGNAFGTLFSTLTSGRGVIQQGRSDGTATSYDLLLQPVGGNVGIGTSSPAKKLTIGGIGIGSTDGLKIEDPSNTAYGAHYSFDDGSTTVEIGGVTNNTLNDCISIARDATRTITINTSEFVGIGTTTPRTKLHVSGLTGDDDPALGSSTGAVFISNTANSYGLNIGVNNAGASWLQAQSNTSATAYEMSLNPLGGNVGVGFINPSYKLDINGTGRFTGDLRCLSLIQTSQRDQKKDIADIDKSKAKAIPFKEYKYKSSIDGSERKRYGVVVEDIENDYPELVHTDADGIKGINYIDLLVKRVAELEKELEDISLTPGPKGDTGATGAQGPAGSDGRNGADGNDHLKNVQSIAFNEKSGQLEIIIEGYKDPFRFNPAK